MVILVIDNSVAFTGALKCALQEALLFSDRYRFVFVLPANSKSLETIRQKGFKVYTLPFVEISRSPRNILMYLPMQVVNFFRLRRIIRNEKAELIQVNDFYNLLGAWVKVFGFKGKLFTYVRFLPASVPTLLRKCWIYFAQRFSFRVIAVSDTVLSQLPAKPNIIRIYDPVLFEEKWAPQSSRPMKGTTLLYLANYIPGKGQNYAIEAFAAAVGVNPSLHLVFAGGDMGLKKNKIYKQDLIRHSVNLGIAEQVEFLSFSEDIESLIKSANIVLNFSEAESFSLTCVEASFYGRPVIVTKCGGPEEIVVNNVTGLLVGNRNVEEMKQAILHLCAHPEWQEEFGRSGRKYVMNKFDPIVFKENFRKIIEG